MKETILKVYPRINQFRTILRMTLMTGMSFVSKRQLITSKNDHFLQKVLLYFIVIRNILKNLHG